MSDERNWRGEPAKKCWMCGSHRTCRQDETSRKCGECGNLYAVEGGIMETKDSPQDLERQDNAFSGLSHHKLKYVLVAERAAWRLLYIKTDPAGQKHRCLQVKISQEMEWSAQGLELIEGSYGVHVGDTVEALSVRRQSLEQAEKLFEAVVDNITLKDLRKLGFI